MQQNCFVKLTVNSEIFNFVVEIIADVALTHNSQLHVALYVLYFSLRVTSFLVLNVYIDLEEIVRF